MMIGNSRSCPICRSDKKAAITMYAEDHLVRCRRCGLVYAGVVPSQELLDEMYNTYPVHAALNPITRKRYQEILQQLEPYRKSGRLLDAGSGSGFFLDVAKGSGWEVHGSEYDPVMVERCRQRGINMWQGQLTGDSFPSGHFDAITSFEVIEHLKEPLEELRFFHGMLRTGGILYLTTPNYGSLNRLISGADWSIENFPEHLNYFDHSTIRKILREAGFKVRSVNTTGISINRLAQKRTTGNIDRPNIDPGNRDQRLRQRIEGNAALKLAKSAANLLLNVTRRGDSLKVFAERI